MKRWPTKPLGEVCEFVRGITFKPTDLIEFGSPTSLACFRTKNVQASLEDDDLIYLPRSFAKNEKQFVREGDTLISTANSNNLVGKCCFVPHLDYPATLGGFIAAVRAKPLECKPRFLYYWLSSPYTQERLRGLARQTTNISNLPLADVSKEEVPVPPLADQKRIVKLLDEADELRKLRAQADKRTADLIPALFNEMFGSAQFESVRVGELTSLVTSGSTPRGGEDVYTSQGPYFIRSQNVQMNRLDMSDVACLPLEVHEHMARTRVAAGDVLLNITGASIGRVAWVERLGREANVSQHVCLIRPNHDRLIAPYLSVFISLPATQRFILQIQAGASRQALNHKQVRTLEIPLPPLPLQKEFAQRVAEIRELETGQASCRHRLEALFQSMLHRAFNGEL